MYDEDYPIGKEYNFAKKSFRDSKIWKYFEESDVKKLYACGIFEDIDEKYIRESEKDSKRMERIGKKALENEFIVVGQKKLKNLNVKTGTYYDENGYDIKGYNAKGLTKDFVLIDTAKKLLHKHLISGKTLLTENTTINNLLEQAGYEDYSTRKRICLELGINIDENIGGSLLSLKKAYYISENNKEFGRMFKFYENDLYDLVQLGIIPIYKISFRGEIQIGIFKGMRIPEYEKAFEQQEEERRKQEEEKREKEERRQQEEERKKQELFDGITTGIKLLHRGIIESGEEISETVTTEELLRQKGYKKDEDIEQICIELDLNKDEKIGEKIKQLKELYNRKYKDSDGNTVVVKKDNDYGKRFWEFSENLLELWQLGIISNVSRTTGVIKQGVFKDEIIKNIKQKWLERNLAKQEKTEEEKILYKKANNDVNKYFKVGLKTVNILLNSNYLFDGEIIGKNETFKDILIRHNVPEEKIAEICTELKIQPEEEIGYKIDMLKKAYLNTPDSKIYSFGLEYKADFKKLKTLIQLEIIPIGSVNIKGDKR